MRIRNELILTFILIISLQFLLLFAFVNYSYTKAIVEKQAQMAVGNLNTVSGLTDGVMDQAEFQLTSLVGDMSLNHVFKDFKRKPSYAVDADTQTIIQKMSQFGITNRFIDGGYVYLYKPQVIIPRTSSSTAVVEVGDPKLYNWINVPFTDGSNITAWTLSFCAPPVTYGTMLMYKMKIIDQQNKDAIGEACIFMLVSNLRNSMLEYGLGQTGRYFCIVDKANTVLMSKSTNDTGGNIQALYGLHYNPGSGWYEAEIEGERCLVAYTAIQHSNWSIMEAIPFSEFSTSIIDQFPFAIWSIALISITTVSAVFVLFSKHIYKPINLLSKSMQRIIEGDLSVRIESKRKDEFSILIRGFNEMMQRISKLIDELYLQKLLTKEAEIQTLRSQLNPHFLYNTLDTLHWMARLGENEKVADLTMAVSRFYQLSLNKGSDITTVRDAVEMVWQYLNIQKARLGDKLDMNIHVDDALLERALPHFILQPLLENAILHGINRKQDKGTININFIDECDNMTIAVEDDGAGIEPGRLAEINSMLRGVSKVADASCFALWNINRQLKLKYGQGEWMRIESQYGIGTKVAIIIPKQPIPREGPDHV